MVNLTLSGQKGKEAHVSQTYHCIHFYTRSTELECKSLRYLRKYVSEDTVKLRLLEKLEYNFHLPSITLYTYPRA